MKPTNPEAPPTVAWWKVALPVALGLVISAYLIATTFNPASLKAIRFSGTMATGLLLGLLFVLLRDLAFMYKIRLSTGNKLSWPVVFVVVMLWEFGSAISPGAVGGIAFALFLLKREGLSYGHSTATVLMNTFLDNLAFALVFCLLYFVCGASMFDVSNQCADIANNPLLTAVRKLGNSAWVGVLVYVGISVFLGIALFILPNTIARFFYSISSLRWLSFFSSGIKQLGADISTAAIEFKGKDGAFWFKMCAATLVNWTSRFALAPALIYGFTHQPLDYLQVYVRQYIMWVFQVIPSTPGASGVAEVIFMAMNCEFIPTGLSATVATLWRIYSYYIYLLVGVLVIRSWVLHGTGKTTEKRTN